MVRITEKLKADFQATLNFWAEASINVSLHFDKASWSGFETIKHLEAACAFCEYFVCHRCPLHRTVCANYFAATEQLWTAWRYAGNTQEKNIFAKKIYDRCYRWCQQNVFDKNIGDHIPDTGK